MRFKLEKLDYQEKAIQSVVDVLDGQTKNHPIAGKNFIGNTLSLTPQQIQDNLEDTVKNNQIKAERANITVNMDDLNLCVEMETGTGKTLVYLQTIFALHKQYNFTKFIILVPSIAIKEGVVSTFEAFQNQLINLHNVNPNFSTYESSKVNSIDQFIADSNLQIMVMTLQSFNSDDNILNRTQVEGLPLENTSWLESLAATRPIIIMDEPQAGMDTSNAKKRIESLKPLVKIRYSATHKLINNLIYRLTPYESYNLNLVKRIDVMSVIEKNDASALKLELKEVINTPDLMQCVLLANYQRVTNKYTKDRAFKFQSTKRLSCGDDLYQITKNPTYKEGFVIEEIGKPIYESAYVKFRNGIVIREGQSSYDKQTIFSYQLEYLIREHFHKREFLAKQGIKCLSLIFIDRVANYIDEDGIIKKLFEQQYQAIYLEKYGRSLSPKEINQVQGSYFAQTQRGQYIDRPSSRAEKDLYKLIFKDKERLLSLDNPVEFIFSHSALGIGWDNPNIFNIATLNETVSEIRKRQEIGRGLRICVNQDGKRVHDEDVIFNNRVNRLTIIPNQSYQEFVDKYQQEIWEDTGDERGKYIELPKKGVTTKIKRINKQYNSEVFQKFWQNIAIKTEYIVKFNETRMTKNALQQLNQITTQKPIIEVGNNEIVIEQGNEVRQLGTGIDSHESQITIMPIDLIQELSDKTTLTRASLTKIISQLNNKQEIVKNPVSFIQQAVEKLQQVISDEIFKEEDGLVYRTINEAYDLSLLEPEIETVSQKLVNTAPKGIYEQIIYDSDIEKKFVEDAMKDNDAQYILKLPHSYKINTPTGKYNPDFGIILLLTKSIYNQKSSVLFFVVETKGTNNIDDKHQLSLSESQKMKYAKKHFKALGINVISLPVAKYVAPVNAYETFKEMSRQYVWWIEC